MKPLSEMTVEELERAARRYLRLRYEARFYIADRARHDKCLREVRNELLTRREEGK